MINSNGKRLIDFILFPSTENYELLFQAQGCAQVQVEGRGSRSIIIIDYAITNQKAGRYDSNVKVSSVKPTFFNRNLQAMVKLGQVRKIESKHVQLILLNSMG